MNERDPLLAEREKTHGNFKVQFDCSQRLKGILKDNGYKNLSPAHREVVEMICMKLSRIVCGQHNFKDHYDDIAGYAKLGSEACD